MFLDIRYNIMTDDGKNKLTEIRNYEPKIKLIL